MEMMPPKNSMKVRKIVERARGRRHDAAAHHLAPAVDDEMHPAGDADDRPAQRNDDVVEAPQERQHKFRLARQLGHGSSLAFCFAPGFIARFRRGSDHQSQGL
jgi:hypothetical protein